jgi:hypothetical protein
MQNPLEVARDILIVILVYIGAVHLEDITNFLLSFTTPSTPAHQVPAGPSRLPRHRQD